MSVSYYEVRYKKIKDKGKVGKAKSKRFKTRYDAENFRKSLKSKDMFGTIVPVKRTSLRDILR